MSNLPPPPLPPGYRRIEDDPGMRLLLPVGRSGLAIAAGYVGLISVLLFPAPVALLLGILAIFDIRKSRATPQPKHGMGRAIFGIVMGALFTPFLIMMLIAILHR